MEKNAAAAYDETIYPSAVYPQTYPGSLAVVAALSGLNAAPVERCRALELGCGDGFNLLSMAYSLPQSEFVGVDLAPQTVARGMAMIAKLGLKNITLHAMDVAEIGEDFGQFDYIIAHGLYSWVPQPVRERIMEICSRNLSARGIVYLSYNAYPGNHFRDMARGIMRYHASHFSNPLDQIRQARGIIDLLAEAGEKEDHYFQVLGFQGKRLHKYIDTGFYHDDLSPINQPFYFHQVMAAATQNGLQFLGEADVSEKRELPYPPAIQALLAQLDPNDIIGAEQYRDFARNRTFRQTLLCHQETKLNHQWDPDRVFDLYLAGEIRPAVLSNHANVFSHEAELFIGLKKTEFETDRPLIKAAFARLSEAWPHFVHFPKLVEQLKADLAHAGEKWTDSDQDALAYAMLQAAMADGLQFLTYRPHFLLKPSEKPKISELARVQIQTSTRVSTLLHGVVQIDDELSRLMLSLLDGTRDRVTLVATLQKAIDTGEIKLPAAAPKKVTEADLQTQLEKLSRLALFIA